VWMVKSSYGLRKAWCDCSTYVTQEKADVLRQLVKVGLVEYPVDRCAKCNMYPWVFQDVNSLRKFKNAGKERR
jgi:hypothetical protein